jgi:hypothetical protein
MYIHVIKRIQIVFAHQKIIKSVYYNGYGLSAVHYMQSEQSQLSD